ncbi:MAG TPA: thioredoxin domain-containing protein [Candidatus Stackebrandtia faecavium]|nr:thioredoxin domain-containing protein [Candidatus Stackebrandtia faecavium]
MANRLGDSMSPYLQQHADNPVNWRPWGPEALTEARERDVPLLISVGYAACHWCHVMAHESFEDAQVATLMNDLTVPVKVDREERPDIDAVYMQATVAMTGQGGWPMTVFATPDGAPFFAGTYFPREHFLRLLHAVDEAWTKRRDEVLKQGNTIVEACASSGPRLMDVTQACPIGEPCPPTSPVSTDILDAAASAVLSQHDSENGGFGGAPKFPSQPLLDFLMRHHQRTGHASSLEAVRRTAQGMARGGMYDQIGGGFARYSVDSGWTVPHFEKMLYDNALLLETYLDVYAATGDEFFARIADETARFFATDWTAENGGFSSAFDADTEGVEGATYVWTPQQLRDVLGEEDGDWACEIFGVTQEGTFEEGASVLQFPRDTSETGRLSRVKERLLAARRDRPQPARDDKIVAAWNGLAVLALTRYAVQRDAKWADELAHDVAEVLRDRHIVDGRLRRVSMRGQVSDAAGILEDYAAVALAFLARHRHDSGWLEPARALVDTVRDRFRDTYGSFYDTADDAEQLVTRPADPTDGPTPSGAALAARALNEFYEASGDDSYRDDAWRAVAAATSVLEDYPRFAGGLAAVAEDMVV